MLHSKQAKVFIEQERLIQSADEAEQRAERRLYREQERLDNKQTE